MKTIQTLIRDISQFVESQQELDIPLTIRFGERKEPPTLRLSKMGPICPRHLWYSIHRPELAIPFRASTLITFSYGHTVEAMALALARAAGHEVTGEQDELTVLGIKGHRDCVLDGCIVDVKSCNKYIFQRLEEKTIREDDPFGYLDQLDGYLVGSADDDLVRVKDKAYIWGIDKVLGKMVLYEHTLRKDYILARVASHKRIVALNAPPMCTCEEVADGESGNMCLGVKASYSPFKYECFPHVRTFIYSGGPRFFTRVVKRPTYRGQPLVEVDKLGNRVYN